jgi:hypothetical protein
MATIPALVTSPGAVPSAPSGGIGGGQVRASPQVDIPAPAGPAGAQAAGAQMVAQADETTARSSAQLAQYGEQFADQYIKAKLNVDAANRTADLSAQLHEAEFQSSKIPDRDQAGADFDSRVGKIRDDWAAQDVNPKVRAAVDASLPNQIALRKASTQQAAFGEWSKAQVGSLITNLDQYGKQAADAQDPRLTEQLIGQANAAIDGRVAANALGADVAAKMKVDFGSNVYRTKIEIAMQKDMASGVALYNATKGKLNAADERAMGVMAADRTKQLDAETTVSSGMPVMGGDEKDRVHRAIVGQESGGQQVDASGNVLTSPKGAMGAGQITPETFAQFAKPGESITNREDNLRVSKRITDHYMEQYGGDWQRAAVAYFSGPGNVAPPGSPTPWKNDSSDGRVKTSEYVAQVGARLGGSAAPASGDQLAQYKIDALRYRQSVIDNLKLDPEIKARQISIIDQRLGTTNSIVLEQRKSAADAADSAGQALYTGKYQAGTFQSVSDQYRKAGDNSQADVYQFMADHEAQLIEDAKNPPARESTAAKLLPGAAGRIAAQASALQRADIADARAMAVQQRTENRRLGAEEEKNFNEGLTANQDPNALIANARNAYLYYRAAGDVAKAESVRQQLEGALEGSAMAKLPPAEREKAKLEMRERAASADGLSVKEAEIAKQLNKNEAANRERWEKDALSAANDTGAIHIQPFNTAMNQNNPQAQANLQMWATQRKSDLAKATYMLDGNATNLRNNFFTTNEMSDITQKLEGMRPQEAQQFLAQLAVAVPKEAIGLIGAQMSKHTATADTFAAALSLYGSGKDGDIDIANRVITGMKWLTQGGPDGEKRIGDHKLLQQGIDDQLVQARAGMSPDAVRLQNNAITADYIALTANEPNRTDINTKALNQAITDIVGKTMTHNGVSTIIPREIEPYQFRDGVAAINDADVANLRPTANGQPITAEVVRQKGEPVPAGDGKYRIRIPDPLRGGRGTDLIDNNTGQPWVIDIRQLIGRGVSSGLPRGQTGTTRDPLGQNRGTVEIPR